MGYHCNSSVEGGRQNSFQRSQACPHPVHGDPGSEEAGSEQENPNAVIVGSTAAAQAFPGRVYAPVPAPGCASIPLRKKE